MAVLSSFLGSLGYGNIHTCLSLPGDFASKRVLHPGVMCIQGGWVNPPSPDTNASSYYLRPLGKFSFFPISHIIAHYGN